MKIESNVWDDHVRLLFGESAGTLLVEVRKQDRDQFLALFDSLPLEWIGTVVEQPALKVFIHGFSVLDAPLSDLLAAWNKTL